MNIYKVKTSSFFPDSYVGFVLIANNKKEALEKALHVVEVHKSSGWTEGSITITRLGKAREDKVNEWLDTNMDGNRISTFIKIDELCKEVGKYNSISERERIGGILFSYFLNG